MVVLAQCVRYTPHASDKESVRSGQLLECLEEIPASEILNTFFLIFLGSHLEPAGGEKSDKIL